MDAEKIEIQLTVNGSVERVEAYPMDRLLDILREKLGLFGAKEGCGEGECGACSVFMGGELVNSCLIPAVQANSSEIVTIEGVTRDGDLHPVQKAFLKHGGAQCGICTPGMILASIELLEKNPKPTRDEIRHGLGGNLCRCTGYMKIFDSVERAAEMMEG